MATKTPSMVWMAGYTDAWAQPNWRELCGGMRIEEEREKKTNVVARQCVQ